MKGFPRLLGRRVIRPATVPNYYAIKRLEEKDFIVIIPREGKPALCLMIDLHST